MRPNPSTSVWMLRAGLGLFVALSCSTAVLAAPKGNSDAYANCMGGQLSSYNSAIEACQSLPADGTTVATSRSLCLQMASWVFESAGDACSKATAAVIAGTIGGRIQTQPLQLPVTISSFPLPAHSFGSIATAPRAAGFAAVGHPAPKFR